MNDKNKLFSTTTMRMDIPPELKDRNSPIPEDNQTDTSPPKDIEFEQKTIKIRQDHSDSTRFLALLESIYDSVLITSLTGEIIDVNTRALKSFGYDKSTICRLSVTNIISGTNQSTIASIVEILNQQKLSMLDAYCVRQDGFTFPSEIAVNKIFISDEESLCFFIRNISVRKEMEENLRHAKKMKSLHMLAGGVAHDFNNLLTSVIGHIELAMSNITEDEKILEDLDTALMDAKKMAELSYRMLAYSGKGILYKTCVDLNEMINNASTKVYDQVPSNVTFQLQLSSDTINIGGEIDVLSSMTENILINAIEAIGKMNGLITLSTSIVHINNDYINYYSLQNDIKEGDFACIAIADTGYGMDQAIMDKIFDPFFTTKGQGRGLGLSEVQGIVLAHGGAVAIDSDIGKGSTFSILLPLFKTDANSTMTTSKPKPISFDKVDTATIMIADDEPSIVRYAQRVLSKAGFVTITASNGMEAVETFREHADVIDLVLLDLFMPKMNGDEVLRRIRKIRPKVKVLIISGYTESIFPEKFAANEPSGYLYKPFATADFMTKISEVLNA